MGKYKLTVGYVKDIETEDNATVEIESVLYYVTTIFCVVILLLKKT